MEYFYVEFDWGMVSGLRSLENALAEIVSWQSNILVYRSLLVKVI